MAEHVYVNIGHTRKTHGVQGEMKISIEDRYLEDFLKNERIFIDIKGVKVPYFVASVRGKGDLILLLEEVTSKEAAFALQSREIHLRETDLIPEHERELEIEPEEELEYAHLVGFTLVDQSLGEIGAIKEVLDMPQQEMAFLDYQGREVLVPLNAQLIISVDKTGKTVHMDLPDGLLD